MKKLTSPYLYIILFFTTAPLYAMEEPINFLQILTQTITDYTEHQRQVNHPNPLPPKTGEKAIGNIVRIAIGSHDASIVNSLTPKNINLLDKYNHNFGHLAIFHNNYKIFPTLQKLSIDNNQRNHQGDSLILLAIKLHKPYFVRMLIASSGTNIHQPDLYNKTTLTYAREANHSNILKAIEEHKPLMSKIVLLHGGNKKERIPRSLGLLIAGYLGAKSFFSMNN